LRVLGGGDDLLKKKMEKIERYVSEGFWRFSFLHNTKSLWFGWIKKSYRIWSFKGL